MRRTPYTDRSLRENDHRIRQSFEKNNPHSNKQDMNKFTNSITAYMPVKPHTRPYNLQPRLNKPFNKRPLSVNRTYSELKHRNQDKQVPLLNSSNQDLWVSTVKQASKSRVQHREDLSKGKIYRGSSWKPEQKSKTPGRDRREAGRYSHHNRLMQNITPIAKQERISIKQNSRNGGIFDLIGKNVKQRKSSAKKQQEDDFFQYVMRFSYRTKKGSIPSNPDKVNQDAYILTPNINAKTWQHFFSVCDGHGPLGHYVSGYIKKILPATVMQVKNLQKKPAQALMKAFELAYQKMIKQSKIDMAFSGSTIISCYMNQNKVYCCNVGDSRAIIGKCTNKKWNAIPLSQDHKPSLPKEAQRIKKMNGRVQSYRDQIGEPIGPLRVWLKDENVPGLAMTRSFGDLVGASVGVSPVPQIKQFTLSAQDKILLIASDGVFQFLSNQQIIKSLAEYYQKQQIQQASDHLLSMAHKSWSRNSSIIDDITFILIFISYNEV